MVLYSTIRVDLVLNGIENEKKYWQWYFNYIFKVTKISIPGIFLFYHFKIKIKGWHNSDYVSVAKFI